VVLRRYATGLPTVEDMGIIVDSISLQVPAGQTAVLVKNLDLSCDPWMCDHMSNHDDGVDLTNTITNAR